MNAISKEYLLLFRAISDAEETLTTLRAQLISAQQQAEEIFLSDETKEPV